MSSASEGSFTDGRLPGRGGVPFSVFRSDCDDEVLVELSSDLTGSLLLLLSMGDLVTEAECVCGEFLWATADILFDDEILRVSAFSSCERRTDDQAEKSATRHQRKRPAIIGEQSPVLCPEWLSRIHQAPQLGFGQGRYNSIVACLERRPACNARDLMSAGDRQGGR